MTVATGTLTVIEPPEQRGRSFDLTEELTVGRAPGCQVLLEGDTFVSQLHVWWFTRDGVLYVEDLGSDEWDAGESKEDQGCRTPAPRGHPPGRAHDHGSRMSEQGNGSEFSTRLRWGAATDAGRCP